MKRSLALFSALIACLALIIVAPALAATVKANYGLTQGPATCSGKGLYKYTATWKSTAAAKFQLNSGNQCKIGGTICSVSGGECPVTCNATGQCRAEVSGCVIGKGMPWVKVTTADKSAFQQITAAMVGKCQE